MPNSTPIGGRATLIAEFAKAGRKAATVAMKRTLLLLSASHIPWGFGEGIYTSSPRAELAPAGGGDGLRRRGGGGRDRGRLLLGAPKGGRHG